MRTVESITGQVVGYQVRAAGNAEVLGEVEGARPRGIRVDRIPGHPGVRGYAPAGAVLWISHGTGTIFLDEGITPDLVAAAPVPPDEGLEDWYMSDDWWDELLGHYGLVGAAGARGRPALHPVEP